MCKFCSEITSLSQLKKAWSHVKRKRDVSPGIDRETVREFENNLHQNLKDISHKISEGKYFFSIVLQRDIPKKKGSKTTRPIRIYTVNNKVVQTSIRIALERVREKAFLFPEIQNEISVGFLDKNYYKGGSVGVKLSVQKLRQFYKEGYRRFVIADIKDFFEEVDKKRLEKIIFSRLKPCNNLSRLLRKMLNPKVLEIDRYSATEIDKSQTISGVAQGSVVSPLLSNIYLMNFDTKLEENNIKAIRYADDILIAAKTMTQAKKLREITRKLLEKHAKLSFHPPGSKKEPKIGHIYSGLEFLGLFLQKSQKGNRWLIRPADSKITEQKLKLTNTLKPSYNKDLYTRIGFLNRSIKSWFSTYEYAGCTQRYMKTLYRELKDSFSSQVNHLLLSKKITAKQLSKQQMEFLGVLPPKLIFK